MRLTDEIQDLIQTAGLHEDVILADPEAPLFIYHDGELRTVPRSAAAFLRADLLSPSAKLRVLKEPFTDPIGPRERAADVFRRKFGSETYERLIEPLFGGMYGSDPATMPAEYAMNRLMALENAHGSLLQGALHRLQGSRDIPPPASLRDGLQSLPCALYDRHREHIHLETPVVGVRPTDRGRHEIRTIYDSTEFDEVVITTPSSVTAQLLESHPKVDTTGMAELSYNSLVVVHLAAEISRRGFGYQVARSTSLETLGVTWNTSLFRRDDVCTAFFGGMWHPDALTQDPAVIGATACDEFEAVMGVRPSLLGVQRLPNVIPAFDTSWIEWEPELPEGITIAGSFAGNIGLPSRVREANAIASQLTRTRPYI